MRTIAFALAALVLGAAATRPFVFPAYQQCDPKWGKTTIGTTNDTICAGGGLLTTIASAMAASGVMDNGAPTTPATLNAWLTKSGGYGAEGIQYEAVENRTWTLPFIGASQKKIKNYAGIVYTINAETIVHLAKLKSGQWVVLTGGAELPVPVQGDRRGFMVMNPANAAAAPVSMLDVVELRNYHSNPYPLYKQCDPTWGSTIMGGDNLTICQVGCLMSSTSSGLAGSKIQVPTAAAGVTPTPATVNTWLQQNGGFVPKTSDMIENSIMRLSDRVTWGNFSMHPTNDVSLETIKKYINADVPKICIANVMHGGHFVLVVGFRDDGDSLVINDSGFDRKTYSYSKDVVGWRIFEMAA
jgi:hypothetical protein